MTGDEKNPVQSPEKRPTPTRGIPIQLDKERRLRFTLGTIRKLREEFGDDTLETGVSGDSIAKLLWHGLTHEDPDLTIEDVEEMVDMENLDDVMEAVVKATGNRAKVAATKLGPSKPAPPAVAGRSQSDTQESVPTAET